MNEYEKQLIKDLFCVTKELHRKVKLHDDIIERVLLDNPNLIRPETWSCLEEDDKSILDSELAAFEKRIKEL